MNYQWQYPFENCTNFLSQVDSSHAIYVLCNDQEQPSQLQTQLHCYLYYFVQLNHRSFAMCRFSQQSDVLLHLDLSHQIVSFLSKKRSCRFLMSANRNRIQKEKQNQRTLNYQQDFKYMLVEIVVICDNHTNYR